MVAHGERVLVPLMSKMNGNPGDRKGHPYGSSDLQPVCLHSTG